MYESSLELLSNEDIELFTELFYENSIENKLHFNTLKEILYSYDKFDSPCLSELIEKIKKKLKDRYSGYSDNELVLSNMEVIQIIKSLSLFCIL
jgi:hypothetical protein